MYQFVPEEIAAMRAAPGYRPAVQPLGVLCPFYGLNASTICNWAARGLITRYRDGYDMLEIELRLQTRDERRIRHANRSTLAA